jgi:hypothetical protein
MSMQDVPGGPGRFARRDDLGNVKKIQREGRNIAEASGGSYGERARNQELASGAPMDTPEATATGMNPLAALLPTPDAFAQGNEAPLSDGAEGGPGRGSGAQQTPVDAIDQTAVLARAMFMANPDSIILANIVNAFNEENR